MIDKNYAWTPQNLSGVAYLSWDAKNLYVAVDVLDDVHHPAGDGETVITGDSVILAFDPTNRSPDAAAKSCAYYVSSQKPAGGSGAAHAISAQRPQRRPGLGAVGSGFVGLRDRRQDEPQGRASTRCAFRGASWGSTPVFGGKFGFAIQLNDNDGDGPAAHMNWGGGLSPTWRPADFGVITLVEQP